MATYVFVHGAWHGGWCWRKVIPHLRAAGHTAFTPTLTGLGERAHLLHRDIDLDLHVCDIARVIECEDLREVVLVGHSYGGFILTALADRMPERLRRLVYLDAFVPEAGQALFDLLAVDSRALFEAETRQRGDGWRVPPPPLARWGVTDPEDVRWMMPRVTDQPVKTFEQPLALRRTTPPALPRTYLACTVGQKPHYAATAQRMQAQPGWAYHELPTGHDAMVTLPQPLAERLLSIAAAS